jgi:hypothetical protein
MSSPTRLSEHPSAAEPRSLLRRKVRPAYLPVTALLLAVALLVAGCGKSSTTSSTSATGNGTTTSSAGSSGTVCPTSNTTSFAKTKFVLHTGLAFGTFHRYIYKPYKAGTFKKGANGRITAFVKAAATALFIKREVRLATEDVKANPTLCKTLAAPLSKLGAGISGAVSKLKGGDSSGVEDANSQIADLTSKSSAGGAPITESTDENAG